MRIAVAILLGLIGAVVVLYLLSLTGFVITSYTVTWVLWFAAFCVIEGLALSNKVRGDSLSEHGWEWASIKERKRAWRVRRLALVCFMVWLTIHLLTGGFI